MINQFLKKFYTRFMFDIDALPQDDMFPMDISTTFVTRLSPYFQEFLVSEIIKPPQYYKLKPTIREIRGFCW